VTGEQAFPRSALLVLLRHGESIANAEGLFTGVWDVPLSTRGRQQARRAARLLLEKSDLPDLVVTSPLLRATQTVETILEELGRPDLDQLVAPELTERAYGALTGLSKTGVGDIFGAQQTRQWRRSMSGCPPRLGDLVGRSPTGELQSNADTQRLLAEAPVAARVAAERSESLADVVTRVRRCLDGVLTPQLRTGRRILVVAHGNSLRALVSLIDRFDDFKIESLNIPTGEPLLYAVGERGVPVPGSGRYLDPDSANEAALAVAVEGGT
jgi:2,3-bisphosphoglycerate-dependent phosphoglycerate mutase